MTRKSIGVPSHGTVWEVEDPAVPDTWVSLEGLKTFNRNEVAAQIHDETVLTSSYKEKDIGLPDAGNTALEGQYNRADPGQAILHAAKVSGELIRLRSTFVDGWSETNTCYVLTSPFSGSANGGSLAGNFQFENTGEPVWLPPTP